MSVNHYENFPVASLLLPARLRPAVQGIYAFARTADDIADEGNASSGERLRALAGYLHELDRLEAGQASDHDLFANLGEIITTYRLPFAPLRDLLSAFMQDVTTKRYDTFDILLAYCRRSANPVGIIMLHLYQARTPLNSRDSDAICSALQLINFWQDVGLDWQKGRIYIPQEDMRRFGVTEDDLVRAACTPAWCNLMRFEVERARNLLLSGAPLAWRLPGRIGWELRLVVQGGLRILELIEAVDYDVFRRRPKLRASDWALMCWRAFGMKIRLARAAHVG